MRSVILKVIVAIVVIGLAVGGGRWYLRAHEAKAGMFRTVPAARGNLLVAISATGTIEPEEVVDVGAQVAGQIVAFGKDVDGKTVDYRSAVDEGTVLAQIDDSLYRFDAASARAQLAQAKASIVRAKADLLQMQAKRDQAEADWNRAQKLGPSEALAQTVYDQYKANFEVAKANVAVDEANITLAETTADQAQATLDRAERNLAYCTIKSPVKGVIIARRVNIGQTVVSSLNAPSLFLIAKDLKRMELWVAVNEADIGSVHTGQAVRFTVDARPGRTFVGQVGTVRYNASMTQNVVTYTVEVSADNSKGELIPYLTANVQFETHRADNVLLVPNAALRWTPASAQIAQEARNSPGVPAAPESTETPPKAGEPTAHQTTGMVWIPEGAYAKSVRVRVGLSDGTNTEVAGGGLSEGTEVIVGDVQVGETPAQSGEKNPFTPQMPPRTRGGKSN